ncbi:MAG TPA: phosphatase PAP2 family protein [Paludibacteraceae bacterium]|nr:phosphatase PAP2 family protein [Paludibacteraceae bacterium]HQB69058.1 phosphatase PAP2 family protein [Paludibacteraceae bacterium]HRS67649.1 phosphatase PAP2 family protein [Paludibacteraceae bacterium]
MKSTACKLFIVLYLLFAIGLLGLVMSIEKAGLHLTLTNDYLAGLSPTWVSFQDLFFKYITELGGFIPFVIAAVLLFYKIGDSLFVVVAQLLTALFVFPIKQIVSAPRPSLFFQMHFPDVILHQVEGVTLHQVHSFPSGHTATVFSLMLALTLIFQKKSWLAVCFFILAALTAYSRVYLSQHFAEDILLGSFIGVVMTLVAYWLYQRKSYNWYSKSLLDVLKR